MTTGYSYDVVDSLTRRATRTGPRRWATTTTPRTSGAGSERDGHAEVDVRPGGSDADRSSSRNGSTVAYEYDPDGSRDTVSLDGRRISRTATTTAGRQSGLTRGAQVFGWATTRPPPHVDGLPERRGDGLQVRRSWASTRSRHGRRGPSSRSRSMTPMRATPHEQAAPRVRGGLRLRCPVPSPERGANGQHAPALQLRPGGEPIERAGGNHTRARHDDEGHRFLAEWWREARISRGVPDEPGAVSVTGNGLPARCCQGTGSRRRWRHAGPNDTVVQATDVNGNVRRRTTRWKSPAGRRPGTTRTATSSRRWKRADVGLRVERREPARARHRGRAEVPRFAYDPLGRRVREGGRRRHDDLRLRRAGHPA